MVASEDVIALFDISLCRDAATAELLSAAERKGAVEHVEVGDAKSVLITTDKIYLSPVSTATLKRRAMVLETVARFHAPVRSDVPE